MGEFPPQKNQEYGRGQKKKNHIQQLEIWEEVEEKKKPKKHKTKLGIWARPQKFRNNFFVTQNLNSIKFHGYFTQLLLKS